MASTTEISSIEQVNESLKKATDCVANLNFGKPKEPEDGASEEEINKFNMEMTNYNISTLMEMNLTIIREYAVLKEENRKQKEAIVSLTDNIHDLSKKLNKVLKSLAKQSKK